MVPEEAISEAEMLKILTPVGWFFLILETCMLLLHRMKTK